MQVYLSDTMQNIAELIEDVSSDPILVNPSCNYTSSPQPVQIVGISIKEFEALLGSINLTVVGQLHSIIGNGFTTPFKIRQDYIPASFRK